MNGTPPPAAPNFRQAATDQGQANIDAANQQANLNNPNFNGIGGSQRVTIGPDGRPVVTQSLDANQQGLYDQYTQNQGAAGRVAGNILGSGQIGSALDLSGLSQRGTALDPNSLPAMPGNYDNVRNQVIDAMMARSNVDINQRQDQSNSDLIARGLRPGTEAYQREMDTLNRQRNDAMQQAQIAGGNAATQAIQTDLARRGAATGEQGQSFTQAGQLRGQDLNELLTQRQLPMSEFTTLMNGSAYKPPTLPGYNGNTQVAPAPVYGAATAQSNYDVDTWNAMMQQQNSRNNGLFSLGNNLLNSPTAGGLINSGLNYVGNNAGNWWDSLTGLFD